MDSNMRLRVGATAGDLTEGVVLGPFPLAPMPKPMYLHMNIPQGGDDGLSMYAYYNDGNSNALFISLIEVSESGHFHMPIFCDHETLDNLSVSLITEAESPNFGEVDVWISNSPVW